MTFGQRVGAVPLIALAGGLASVAVGLGYRWAVGVPPPWLVIGAGLLAALLARIAAGRWARGQP